MMTLGFLLRNGPLRQRLEPLRTQPPPGLAIVPDAAAASADILITDHAFPANPDQSTDAAQPHFPDGVVAVGGSGPADVVLPEDATVREVHLACTLLGEIVRLRRAGSEQQSEQRRMWLLAHSDPLTGIPNRRGWDSESGRRLASLESSPNPTALALFDLDHFKQINESYGHARGDEVLRAAAAALTGGLRSTDFVARLGGDEFGGLLHDCAAPADVLDRLRRAIGQRCTAAAGRPLSVSIGFAVARPGEPAAALFDRADAALRRAKVGGRDRVVVG